MRVMPRIHPDVQALRFRTEQRALDRMNQARERQFAQRDRTLTRQRELADRMREVEVGGQEPALVFRT